MEQTQEKRALSDFLFCFPRHVSAVYQLRESSHFASLSGNDAYLHLIQRLRMNTRLGSRLLRTHVGRMWGVPATVTTILVPQ